MNHIYRLVFNRRLGLTQVAPETARAHGKGDSGKAAKVCAGGAALALFCAASPVLAADTFIDTTGNTVIGTGGGTHGSPWNVGGWLFVGDNATGDLTISNGGQVSNGLSTIGYYGSGNGTVTVTGSGSTWTNSGTLRIGYDGTGTLIIENGGQVSSQEGRLGVQASSSAGTVTVTGAGSQWTTNGNVLRVGQYGTGTLIIANGGTVLSGAGFIGEQVSSTGSSVTVTGGGNWTSTEVSLNRGGVLNIGNYNGSDTAGTVTTGRIFYGGVGTRGAVNFNQTDNITFATPIEGNVSVYQRGSGKTTFTTNQAYTNGTFIDSGTLALSGSGSIANSTGVQLANTLGATFDISGVTASATIKTLSGGGAAGGNVVLGSKTLVVELNGNGFYDGVISGTGGLTKSNAGTLRLTGNHTYSGGTSILGGTLLVGAGGTTGSIVGDVTNNAALVFNRSDALTFSGVVSGSGTLGKQGAGTLTLTGNSTYSGGTTISGGALQIGNGGATGSISGNISNNAALVFNRSNAVTFADVISGSGTLEKQSTGVLSLTGANTYTGLTSINGGTLMLSGDGSIAASSGVTLADTASAYLDIAFTTSGTSIKALNGGGSSGGNVLLGSKTLTIDGGGTYAGEISGAGGSLTKTGADTLTLTGNNTYAGGTTISNGTLQIGNGGTAGSITGNVTNNSALVFNRSDATSFAGVVSGSGSLEKQGTGTLTLTGNNSYSGGTQISAGTLIGDTSSIQGNIANAGTLEFAQATDGSFAGNIAGLGGTDGTVVKSDNGTLTLGGNSSLDWTLQGGGLVTAAERFTGNAILQSGTNLTFNQNSDASYGGQISGTGNFTKSGSGTLTLTGTNSHNGTLINAGTLSISSDANLGNAVSPLLFNGGTLATTASFDTNRNVVLLSTGRLDVASGTTLGLQGNVLGTGPLIKTGTGTLNLTGDNSAFTGATSIEAGVLKVNGSLGGSVLVENAGTLGGNGTLGSATVQSGGTLAPGNSIGTLNVGNITFNPGSVYQVEINAAGQSDRILATGTASINGGLVDVRAEDGNYASQTSYTILSAAGGRTGVFDGVTSNLAFLTPSLSYDPNNVYLTMSRNDISFRAIGQTPNQIATGGGVESLGLGNPVYDLALGLSAPQARDAFDQLSGELHASVQGAIIQDSRWVRDAANARLRALSDTVGHDNNFWVRAIGNWGKDDGTSNAASLDRDSRGLLAGFDAQLGERGQGGFLLGKTRSDMNAGWGRGSADVDNLHLGLYGALSLNENLSLRGGAFYGQHQIDSKRSVQVRTLNNRLSDQRDAQSLQTFAELAYRASLGKMTLEPFANLANVQLHSDSSSESGGVAALNSASRDSSTSFLTLGVRPSLELDMGKTKAKLYGSLGWQHAFGDTTPKVTQRFIGAGNQFTVAGTPIAKDATAIEAGMRMELGANSSLNLSYSGQFANQAQDQSANATLEWRF